MFRMLGKKSMRKLLLVILMIIVLVVPVYAVTTEEVLRAIRIEYPKWSMKYEAGFFDCSEMSAYVSYKLTEAEIPNRIVTGRASWLTYWSGHAWVETDEEAIEATSLKTYELSYYAELYISDGRTIRIGNDWDWWNSITNQQWYLHSLSINGNKGERIWALDQLSKDYRMKQN